MLTRLFFRSETEVMLLSGFAVLTLGTLTVYSRKKKLPSSKISGILICVLMISTTTLLVAASASTARAYTMNGRAVIWGSESSGTWVESIETSWRKRYDDEVAEQRLTSEPWMR